MEEGDESRERMRIFTTNEWLRTAPDGALSQLYLYTKDWFGYKTLLPMKKVLTLVSLTFGRLSGLGTSGWRGALSAEGSKSSVQPPPKDAPLAP